MMVIDYGREKEWDKEQINIFGDIVDVVQYCDHSRTTGPQSLLIGLLLAKRLVLIDISYIIIVMKIKINGDDNNT